MKAKLYCLLVLALVLFSCNTPTIHHEKLRNFPENRWASNKVLEFGFHVPEARSYKGELFISHIYNFHLDTVPIKAVIVYPDQSTKTLDLKFAVKDKNGKEIGDCAGDYCDRWQLIFDNEEFPVGNHHIFLTPSTPGPYLPNILSVGVRIKKIQ